MGQQISSISKCENAASIENVKHWATGSTVMCDLSVLLTVRIHVIPTTKILRKISHDLVWHNLSLIF